MGFNSSLKTDYRESIYFLLQEVKTVTRNLESKKPESPFKIQVEKRGRWWVLEKIGERFTMLPLCDCFEGRQKLLLFISQTRNGPENYLCKKLGSYEGHKERISKLGMN